MACFRNSQKSNKNHQELKFTLKVFLQSEILTYKSNTFAQIILSDILFVISLFIYLHK
jgi:hypothetical protein